VNQFASVHVHNDDEIEAHVGTNSNGDKHIVLTIGNPFFTLFLHDRKQIQTIVNELQNAVKKAQEENT